MVIGFGACALIVAYIGWFLWSNFAPNRRASVAPDVSATPQQPAAQQSASSPQADSSAQQAAPLPGNGKGVSIEIASLQVTTRPDGFDDLLGSPDTSQPPK
jgi:hypothetical protein